MGSPRKSGFSLSLARALPSRDRLVFVTTICVTMFLFICRTAWAQSPNYGVGRSPSADEIHAWDIAVSPTGKELPPGRGTAKEGAVVYVKKGCAGCHGATGSGMHAPTLISRKDSHPAASTPAASPLFCLAPCVNDSNSMGVHSPFATTIWDYINRGMPLGKEGTLTPDEVYALTAFLLYKNGVVGEDEVMDEQSLPKVKMPNRNGFALPPDWKHGAPRLEGYP
jgi:S-disulfanyl-L-cysteine oxidoreductase SoxD